MEVIIGSGSLIVSRTINGEINIPSQNRNPVEDIKIIAQVVKNINFLYLVGRLISYVLAK